MGVAKTIKEKPKVKESTIVINEDFSYVSPKDGKTYKMTLKEKSFCDAYLDFKGDGVSAIIEAGYKVQGKNGQPNYKLAAVMAHENLRKPNLIAYVNSKLEEAGFTDDEAYKQHLFLLNQHADLKSKAKAVEMFYRLKGSFAPEKSVNVNLNVDKPNPAMEELANKLNELLKTTD